MLELVYWHKARIRKRFVLEMSIHRVKESKRRCDGLKYGLILVDQHSGARVLFDNHQPKGPHIHLNDKELPYVFVNEKQLMEDFKRACFEHLGVRL